MIKALNISPLNQSCKLQVKCKHCGFEAILKLENSGVNTDNQGNILPNQDYETQCYECGKSLID